MFLAIELEHQSQDPSFWNDNQKAQSILKEIETLKKLVSSVLEIETHLNDAQFYLEMSSEDPLAQREAAHHFEEVEKKMESMEMARMLSSPQDSDSAFMQINAGAGGTESCDWVAMLLRMYTRYADQKGFTCDLMDFTDGDGAGYRSVTLHINGPYAYGYLKAENGVHRLVRVSPFDANQRRHTSFASVYVYPDIEDEINIEVKDADIRIDTYRAGGAGGQKVNKTSSAVRMTHLATNIVVQCQNERSQHQNRAVAMKMLKARLFELEMEKKRAKQAEVEAGKKDIAWGSQIRSYVLHPYKMVKDHRTNFETSQAEKVLDGDLDSLIKTWLKNF